MMSNVAFHFNMFTRFKGLSHLAVFTPSWLEFRLKNTVYLVLIHSGTHKDSMWGTDIGLYFTCEPWTAPMMHCWGWMMTGDSKFSCCWHDNSRSGGHCDSSCRGENGSTLFPSTGHQCKRHLEHVKPAHLHGAHVFKQTVGGRENGTNRDWIQTPENALTQLQRGGRKAVRKCCALRQFISKWGMCGACNKWSCWQQSRRLQCNR